MLELSKVANFYKTARSFTFSCGGRISTTFRVLVATGICCSAFVGNQNKVLIKNIFSISTLINLLHCVKKKLKDVLIGGILLTKKN